MVMYVTELARRATNRLENFEINMFRLYVTLMLDTLSLLVYGFKL